MLKRQRFRIYPTQEQAECLDRLFGCARWVYNWGLQSKTEHYKKTGEGLSIFELSKLLTKMKKDPETAWLKEANAQSLQQSLRHLDAAFTRFFKGQNAYPKFKSKGKTNQSITIPQGVTLDFDAQRLYIPKLKSGIRAVFHRDVDGEIKNHTIFKVSSGKFYVSILIEDGKSDPETAPSTEVHAIGLDFGLKDLVITSDGERFANPRTLKRHLRRLKIRQRRMTRKVKGSKNRDKARKRLATIHERISFIRTDSLHKISSHLVRENQATTLCLENLDVQDMKKNRLLSRSIGDAGWAELRKQIEYKARWNGKNVRIIGRFEASSKTCHRCGQVNHHLTLSDRSWTCACGVKHDRDINAAINIRQFAFCDQNTQSLPRGSRKITPVEQPVRAAMNQERHPDEAATRFTLSDPSSR